jgi:uncharacterized protein
MPAPETEPFWEAAKRGELLIQRCAVDGTAFPYRRRDALCAVCRSRKLEAVTSAGRGFVYSFVTDQRQMPGILPPAPSVIVLVELDEGPRLVAALSEVDPASEAVHPNMRVAVRFAAHRYAVPYFVPEALRDRRALPSTS